MNLIELISSILEASLRESGTVIVPCEPARNALNGLLPPEARVLGMCFAEDALKVDFVLNLGKAELKFTLAVNFVPPTVADGVWSFDLPAVVTGNGFAEKLLLGLKAPELLKRLPLEAVKSIPPEVFEVLETRRLRREVKVPRQLEALELLGVSGDDAALKLHFQLRH